MNYLLLQSETVWFGVTSVHASSWVRREGGKSYIISVQITTHTRAI